MLHLIVRVMVTALALILVSRIVPGISIDGIYTAIIAALILGLFNILVKPVLFVLTLPLSILSFGLFAFVLNAAMFELAAYFVPGFGVAGFIPALVGSVIVTTVSTLAHRVLG